MFGANSRDSLSVVLECYPANVFNPTTLVRQDTRAMTSAPLTCPVRITSRDSLDRLIEVMLKFDEWSLAAVQLTRRSLRASGEPLDHWHT